MVKKLKQLHCGFFLKKNCFESSHPSAIQAKLKLTVIPTSLPSVFISTFHHLFILWGYFRGAVARNTVTLTLLSGADKNFEHNTLCIHTNVPPTNAGGLHFRDSVQTQGGEFECWSPLPCKACDPCRNLSTALCSTVLTPKKETGGSKAKHPALSALPLPGSLHPWREPRWT